MPEFFLELFSEEIPARMQARAASDLFHRVTEALAPLAPTGGRSFFGPRRIAMVLEIAGAVAAAASSERGPRLTAPEQALSGFLRKHNAARDQLRQEGNFWILEKIIQAEPAAERIALWMPILLRQFPWPKSMRWGGTSTFTWVRPLRRVVCLVDGQVVPFDLRDGDDDGHGLVASNLTEGHRFHAPGSMPVASCADWQAKLRDRRVLADADERKRVIADALAQLAASHDMTVVDDPGLLDEVAGLVEWPVVLLGRIEEAFMDLPPEVMQVSMRVNQRYFALRSKNGSTAPLFAFVANIEATDGGAAIIAGNERVLRARFSDARYFWDLDRKVTLQSLVPRLDAVTFHAKLGSQGERVARLMNLAERLAPVIGADAALARRAAELCKADLLTGMVGEFPELQGVMGGYYAQHDNEDTSVADAIRDHYGPKGPSEAAPSAPVTIAVALADKLDQLVGFFAIGEKPTGSGDPYALRRAALGIFRIIRENELPVSLQNLIKVAAESSHWSSDKNFEQDVLDFLFERIFIQLRAEGIRPDVLSTVAASKVDDVIPRLLARVRAVASFLQPEDATGKVERGDLTILLTGIAAHGAIGSVTASTSLSAGSVLLSAYRRAANILRIEEKKDGPHDAAPNPTLFAEPEEVALALALDQAAATIDARLAAEDYAGAMSAMAQLRTPLDAFFEQVTVNAPEPELRRNRLRLLSRVRVTMDRVADFSKIEG